LKKIIENRTVITIAHRLKTIEHCDLIYFMQKGDIRECGTHDELMELKGNYYNLYLESIVAK